MYNAITRIRINVLGGGETMKREENRDIKRSFGEYSDLMDAAGMYTMEIQVSLLVATPCRKKCNILVAWCI